MVKVEYEPLEPLLALTEAVEKGSFYELYQNQIVRGDVETALKSADFVAEGREHYHSSG